MNTYNLKNPIIGISLKNYFSLKQTHTWVTHLVESANLENWPSLINLFVIPNFISLLESNKLLQGSGITLGAQDVFWEDLGPFTGEISASLLKEAGCKYVEIGHAERRRLFNEDDEITSKKAKSAAENSLIPIVCIGERNQSSINQAIEFCKSQIDPVLSIVNGSAQIIFAYEPVWAIGQKEPADPIYTKEIASKLKRYFSERPGITSLIYGGSAGPGLFTQLYPEFDGLFLGRFAHDIKNIQKIFSEIKDRLIT